MARYDDFKYSQKSRIRAQPPYGPLAIESYGETHTAEMEQIDQLVFTEVMQNSGHRTEGKRQCRRTEKPETPNVEHAFIAQRRQI